MKVGQKRTILIVDDHPLFREGLKAIIARDDTFQVVGEAGSGHEALETCGALKPDLVLVDVSLPDQSGIELTREIRKLLPKTRVMMVTMHTKVDYIARAFQAGATGYVVKESTPHKLLQALEAVSKGEYFMDSTVSHKVIKKIMQPPARALKITDAAYDTLSQREQEVLVLLAEGLSAQEIAERFFISPKTVENHRGNIMRKLDIHSTHQLIRYAAKLGLIDLDLWKD